MEAEAMGGVRRVFFILIVGILFSGQALCGSPSAAGAIRVLLLPAIDTTPDAPHMLPARQFAIRPREEYAFLTRGFTVLGETLAAQAARVEPAIDLGAFSAHDPEHLDQIGRRAGADWVVSLVVRDVRMEPAHGDGPGGRFTIASRLLVQIRDVAHSAWLANREYTARIDGNGSPIFVFKQSLEAATAESLEAVLAPYPATVTVSTDGRIVDYLAGQTVPVAGHPGIVFSGLNPGTASP